MRFFKSDCTAVAFCADVGCFSVYNKSDRENSALYDALKKMELEELSCITDENDGQYLF
jgi:hypothetical protein